VNDPHSKQLFVNSPLQRFKVKLFATRVLRHITWAAIGKKIKNTYTQRVEKRTHKGTDKKTATGCFT
jgi:hypothetical protein